MRLGRNLARPTQGGSLLATMGFERESLWDSRGDDHVTGGGMGIRGGAVCSMSSISAGVRAQAWMTKLLRERSKVEVSAARAWAGALKC